MNYRIILTDEQRLDQIHRAIIETGRMFAGDDGDAESGPAFWYDCHKLGRLEAHVSFPGLVRNDHDRTIYCTADTFSQAREDAKELALCPPQQFYGGDARMRPTIDPRL